MYKVVHTCVNGTIHRIDGPAIEYTNGNTVWCLNGKVHRINGPAYEGADGVKAWYLNHRSMIFDEWKQEVRKYYDTDEDYLLMLLKLD